MRDPPFRPVGRPVCLRNHPLPATPTPGQTDTSADHHLVGPVRLATPRAARDGALFFAMVGKGPIDTRRLHASIQWGSTACSGEGERHVGRVVLCWRLGSRRPGGCLLGVVDPPGAEGAPQRDVGGLEVESAPSRKHADCSATWTSASPSLGGWPWPPDAPVQHRLTTWLQPVLLTPLLPPPS